jgi:hypothetical protein
MANLKGSASLSSLESTLEEYFVKKAPFQLPPGAKEAIVKFGPWIMLILLVMSLPIIFAALGLSAALLPATMMAGYSPLYNIGLWISVASLVVDAFSLPGLFARKMSGWRLAFYASLLSVVSSLVMGQIVSAIISAVIGLYILFQVKSMYK